MLNIVRFTIVLSLLWQIQPAFSAATYTPGQKIGAPFQTFVKGFIAANCLDCHGDTEPNGNLSLHDLGPVNEINAATWWSVWAQVTLKEMPPRDAGQACGCRPAEVLRLDRWGNDASHEG